jgi:hypothetical protein
MTQIHSAVLIPHGATLNVPRAGEVGSLSTAMPVVIMQRQAVGRKIRPMPSPPSMGMLSVVSAYICTADFTQERCCVLSEVSRNGVPRDHASEL